MLKHNNYSDTVIMNSKGESNNKKMRSKSEEIRLELKKEWKSLWNYKYDDYDKAEGISPKTYPKLFVEEGQVIYASKKCEPLDFEKILKKNLDSDCYQQLNPPPEIGGWKKFSKEHFPKKKKREKPKIKVDLNQQQRKHGKGWLNQIRMNKK